MLAVAGAAPVAAAARPGPIIRAAALGAVCDGTMHKERNGTSVDGDAIQKAIGRAERSKPGGTVVIPAGHCVLTTALNLSDGSPVTVEGTTVHGSLATTVTDTVNPAEASGDLDILDNGNTVQDLVFDQRAYGGAAYVRGDDNTLRHMRLLGGRDDFVLSEVGKPHKGPDAVGNKLLDSSLLSLVDHTVYGHGPACDDGIEWGHQDKSLIENVTFTGTRLALFQDEQVDVVGYTYYPGPQTCGLNGWEITQPSDDITLEDLTMYGSAGTIGNPSADPGSADDITVDDERVEDPTAGGGYHLRGPIEGLVIHDVDGVTVKDCHLDSDGANAQIVFSPEKTADGVAVVHTTVSQVRFVGSTKASLNGTTTDAEFKDDTFTAYNGVTSPLPNSFVNNSGARGGFTVDGGSWHNRVDGEPRGGLIRGDFHPETVVGLAGY